MLSFECIKNEKSVYFLLTSALPIIFGNLVIIILQIIGGSNEKVNIYVLNMSESYRLWEK